MCVLFFVFSLGMYTTNFLMVFVDSIRFITTRVNVTVSRDVNLPEKEPVTWRLQKVLFLVIITDHFSLLLIPARFKMNYLSM